MLRYVKVACYAVIMMFYFYLLFTRTINNNVIIKRGAENGALSLVSLSLVE